MKYLIIRMYPNVLNIKSYNCQEIGLAKAMIRKGNQCDIVLYTDKNKNWDDEIIFDENRKIHVYYLKAKSIFKNAFFDKKLYELIKQYDIVQTAEYDQLGNIKLRRLLGDKLVIYHGPYESEYTKGYKKKCVISDFIIKFYKDYKNTPCLSKSVLATDFLRKKGFKNIKTVGVGLDDEKFKKSEDVTDFDFLRDKGKYKYLLYIGRLEERRNILFMFDVLKNVSENNKFIKLVIIGKGNKEYTEKCWNYARKINVIDKIIYIESMNQENLPAIYKKCDIFLLPTKYEIFGMVLLESMYWGVPVITTVNGGSSCLINEKNGVVINSENNVNEWAKNIRKVIENPNKYKENAKKTVRNGFLWDNLCEKFLE